MWNCLLSRGEDTDHDRPKGKVCILASALLEVELSACQTITNDIEHTIYGTQRSRDVVWAGNPDEPKLRIGGILCPRNSFAQFMEKAHKESRAWSTQDLHVITVFRDRICEHAHNWMMRLLQNDIEDTNKKYLNAIDRAKDNYEFFAHMSHELVS